LFAAALVAQQHVNTMKPQRALAHWASRTGGHFKEELESRGHHLPSAKADGCMMRWARHAHLVTEMRVAGIAGLSVTSNISSGCSIAAIGAAYINLANTTGGRVFDICQTDWTENFNKLTEGLVAAAQNTFTLKNRAKRILDVYINGKPVSLSKVFSSANNITISPDVLNPNGETNILINYAY
jgi:hypothetical protein